MLTVEDLDTYRSDEAAALYSARGHAGNAAKKAPVVKKPATPAKRATNAALMEQMAAQMLLLASRQEAL